MTPLSLLRLLEPIPVIQGNLDEKQKRPRNINSLTYPRIHNIPREAKQQTHVRQELQDMNCTNRQRNLETLSQLITLRARWTLEVRVSKLAMVVILDVATGWLQCYPVKTKHCQADEVCTALRDIRGPRLSIKVMYSDNVPELVQAAWDKSWVQNRSVPGMSKNNALVKRMVRRMQEGTRCLLLQAGLHLKWWLYAAKCFCCMNNVQKKDGMSPWLRRFSNEEFAGELIPCTGILISVSNQQRLQSKTGK
eukprot:1923852-Amphidinium_carterae.1